MQTTPPAIFFCPFCPDLVPAQGCPAGWNWGLEIEGDLGIGSYRDDPLTDRIIWCIIRVHQTLGAGFLERVYRRALIIELRKQGLVTLAEQEIDVFYDGRLVGRHRLDLIVERRVIVELKTVECLNKAHYAQVRSYLKASGLQLALLVNFAEERATFRRIEISSSNPIP